MPESLFNDIQVEAMITEISPSPKDPNLRRVRVARRIVAMLRASDVEALKLRAGLPFTAEIRRSIEAAQSACQARALAMQLLGKRAMSRGEVVDRLTKKGHDIAIAQQIADELAADKWIDDAAYGESIIRNLTRSKPASRSMIASKLRSRKIDSQLADDLARRITRDDNPVQLAMEFGKHKLATWHGLDATKLKRRLAGTLARRGFDHDVVSEVLNRLLQDEDCNS